MSQLALFDLQVPPQQPRPDLIDRVRAAMGMNFGNFRWWCFNGNREMCAAVLWQSKGFTQTDATEAVAELAKTDPGLMWPTATPEELS